MKETGLEKRNTTRAAMAGVLRLLMVMALLLPIAMQTPIAQTPIAYAQEPVGRWVSPGWNDEVVNVVEYKDGTTEQYVDFSTIDWSQVERAGFRLKPGRQVAGFDQDYGQLVWYPNYNHYDKPAMHCFLRFWGEYNGTWYKRYLNSSDAKTPVYQEGSYIHNHNGESVPSYWKELGWEGSIDIGPYELPFYIGQRADLLSEQFKIKTEVTTPVALEDTALEYVFVVNPNLNVVEKVETIRTTLDTGEVDEWGTPIYESHDIPINQVADRSGDLPAMLKTIAFVLPNGDELAFFDFQDVFDQGISGHWKVDQITLPSGQQAWALHIGEKFGALGAGQTLEIDPGWTSPTGYDDPSSGWGYAGHPETDAYDGSTATWAETSTQIPPGQWSAYLELTHSAIMCSKLRFYAPYDANGQDSIDLDVFYGGAWHGVYQGAYPNLAWVEKDLGGTFNVTEARVRFHENINTVRMAIREFAFYEIVSPTVSTSAANDIEETTAALNGNITDIGAENADERGFDWGLTDAYGSTWTESDGYGTGAFGHGISGLAPGTTYHFRAKAHNSAGWGYGSDLTFTTKPNAPTGLTASNPTGSTLDLSWSKGSGANNTMIRHKTGGYPANVADGDQAYYGTASGFTDTGLTTDTTHYYRGWSYTDPNYSDGYSQTTGYTGDTLTVSTLPAISVTRRTATLHGAITATGNCSVTKYGFDWGHTETATWSDEEVGTFYPGTYTVDIADLEADELYRVRFRATDCNGTVYGDWYGFITPQPDYSEVYEPGGGIAPDIPDLPTNWTLDTDPAFTEEIPGVGFLTSMFGESGFPVSFLWYLLLLSVTTALCMISYAVTKHVLGVAATGGICLALFASLGWTDWWLLFAFILVAIAVWRAESVWKVG